MALNPARAAAANGGGAALLNATAAFTTTDSGSWKPNAISKQRHKSLVRSQVAFDELTRWNVLRQLDVRTLNTAAAAAVTAAKQRSESGGAAAAAAAAAADDDWQRVEARYKLRVREQYRSRREDEVLNSLSRELMLHTCSKRESAFLRTAYALDTRLTGAVASLESTHRWAGIRHVLYLTKQQQWLKTLHLWGGTTAGSAPQPVAGIEFDAANATADGGWATDRVHMMTRVLEYVSLSRAQFWAHFTDPDATIADSLPPRNGTAAAATASALKPAPLPTSRAACNRVLCSLIAHNRAILLQRRLHAWIMSRRRTAHPESYTLTPAQRSLSQANQIVTANKTAMRRAAAMKQQTLLAPLQSALDTLQQQTAAESARLEHESEREHTHFDARWDDWNRRMTRTLLATPLDAREWTVLVDGKPTAPSAPSAPASPVTTAAPTSPRAAAAAAAGGTLLPPVAGSSPAAGGGAASAASAPPPAYHLSVEVIMSEEARLHISYRHVPSGTVQTEHPAMPLIRSYRAEQRTKAIGVLDTRLKALTTRRDALYAGAEEQARSLRAQIEQLRTQFESDPVTGTGTGTGTTLRPEVKSQS